MSEINITVTVNGTKINAAVKPEMSLLRFLRAQLFWDVKCGCEEGDCGTCTVIFNGQSVKSCLVLAAQADGGTVWTNKGLGVVDELTGELQKAFVERGAIQCGFCTPGMIMAGKHYIDQGGKADREEIKKAISGNLCRCTGYKKIVDAIYDVSEKINGSK
ncbi:(2Fe-2S)-binding protein [Candidatus Formimonas warabiya]|uniref:(2Fe-2S)-binding protein n=1 Tax=Formimonas warabiya TaxID=1761012 RepID=A0A3G1KQZ6_FORW1|nr:(2Fe-2S)-binding protein [Candidatus Formimonas warabiya]ATW24881.1 (2Fe-2S)-binding protein [Candidatus Formimonas warabiya]